mmetsp:Transcript_3500/g.6860  ORF Transcript_3500/g.6860 Transcript_3500/m.6860 type:complete len:140 (-) Transcript_3500:342-761(-)
MDNERKRSIDEIEPTESGDRDDLPKNKTIVTEIAMASRSSSMDANDVSTQASSSEEEKLGEERDGALPERYLFENDEGDQYVLESDDFLKEHAEFASLAMAGSWEIKYVQLKKTYSNCSHFELPHFGRSNWPSCDCLFE